MKFGTEFLSPEQLQSQIATDFCSDLVLSDAAKKFVIAREIFRGKKCPHLYESFLPVATLSFSAPFMAYFSLLSNLKKYPAVIKGIAYIFTATVISVVYFSLGDFWRKNAERELDAAACQLGAIYAKGGVEFYDKSLRRHIALRELLPNDAGKKLYNLRGDVYPGVVRTKFVPVSSRRESCKSFVEK